MKILIDEIPESGLEFTFSGNSNILSHCVDRVGMPEGINIDPRPRGRLAVSSNDEHIFMTGELDVKIGMQCDRCLSGFSVNTRVDLNLVFEQTDPDNPLGIEDRDQLEGDVVFIDGPELDPCDAIIQEILLGLPIRALCSEDCPGLCPGCGAVKGSQECNCPDRSPMDPRWKALADLKKRINS